MLKYVSQINDSNISISMFKNFSRKRQVNFLLSIAIFAIIFFNPSISFSEGYFEQRANSENLNNAYSEEYEGEITFQPFGYSAIKKVGSFFKGFFGGFIAWLKDGSVSNTAIVSETDELSATSSELEAQSYQDIYSFPVLPTPSHSLQLEANSSSFITTDTLNTKLKDLESYLKSLITLNASSLANLANNYSLITNNSASSPSPIINNYISGGGGGSVDLTPLWNAIAHTNKIDKLTNSRSPESLVLQT